MKNIKKKAIALGVSLTMLASSALSMSASAFEYVSWPGDYLQIPVLFALPIYTGQHLISIMHPAFH